MFSQALLNRLAFFVLALGALFVGACSGGQPSKTAAVKAGDLPAGGEWQGVYYSPVYGYLHIVTEGNSASGKWRTADGGAWGELHGTVTGDLLKYEWVEHKIGLVGPSATSKGRGYFKYSEPKSGEAHEISGEWGLKQDETGNTWKAVKQVNMRPDPNSVMPDEIEGRTEAGGWDETEGTPKPPEGGGEGGEGEGSEGGEGGGPSGDPLE
jgi:hypothetical protein